MRIQQMDFSFWNGHFSSVSWLFPKYRWKTGVAKWESGSCIVDGMIFGKCDASWKDYASQRRVFFEKEMHWDTGMHRKSNVLSRKRCIRENKCISNHAFGRKYDAYEEIYASQITCFQEKEMHASRIMHRNQPNIPKIRCIRRTNTQQKGPSHQVRRPL